MAFKSKPYHSALKMQQVIEADVLNPKTSPSARAQLARAWDVLEDRKRIMRMKGKPKDVDVSKQTKKASLPVFSEPVEPRQ